MTNNQIKVLKNGNALVTKAFAKQAMIFGTPEYKMWREFKIENPQAEMILRAIKRNPNQKTNRNMTYTKMRLFIKEYSGNETAVQEFDKQIKLSQIQKSPYHYILKWFKDKYPNYANNDIFTNSTNDPEENSVKLAS